MNDETNQSKMAPGTTANAAASAAAAAIDLTDLSVPDANRSEEEPGIVVYQVKKLKWLAIDNTTTARDGGKTLTHPFMEDKKNWLDICLTRQLLLDRPFLKGYGQIGGAWVDSAANLSRSINEDDGTLLYGSKGISVKTYKDRFVSLMAYMKANVARVPFESGEDDQTIPNELQSNLEELLEFQNGLVENKANAKQQTATKEAGDSAKADVIRNNALGLLTDANKEVLEHVKGSRKKPGFKSPTPHPLADMENVMLLSSEHQDRKLKIKAAKEERKKRKLEIEGEQAKAAMELEHAKIKAHREERDARLETERAERNSRDCFQQALLNILRKQQRQVETP